MTTDLPAIYAECRLDNYDPTASKAAAAGLDAARRFLDEKMRSLVLFGRPGCGKSHLAAAICDASWEREKAAYDAEIATHADPTLVATARTFDGRPWPRLPTAPRWANVPELLSRLRGGDEYVRKEAADLAQHEGIVVLDDLGREKASEWTAAEIYVLINKRYESLLRTVVTTNLTSKEITENGYGPALSRLAEGGLLLEMATATDYRMRR